MRNQVKKITLLLVIIFTFLFTNTSWGEWTYVTETESVGKFYYDKDRVRKSGKSIYFWMLLDFKEPHDGDMSLIQYTQLDCSIFRYKELRLQVYKKSMGEGENTMDFTPKDEWKYPPPNSSGETLYNKVCEEHQ
jgi:hypothetical protein